MAHQINLHSPILLAPRRHFSAAAMLRALAVMAFALVALCLWSATKSAQLRHELAAAEAFHAGELQRLQKAVAGQRALPSDAVALEQELARARLATAERQQQLDEQRRGLVRDGRSPSALLRLLAATLPPTAWLSEVKLADEKLEISGHTLQPASLQPWLLRLASEPMTAAQRLGLARLDRGTAGGAAESWAFRLAAGLAPGADAGAGTTAGPSSNAATAGTAGTAP